MCHLDSFVVLKMRLFSAFSAAEGWPASTAKRVQQSF